MFGDVHKKVSTLGIYINRNISISDHVARGGLNRLVPSLLPVSGCRPLNRAQAELLFRGPTYLVLL